MARVPGFKRSVGPRALPTVFDSGAGGTPEAFGAAEGRATSALGGAVSGAADVAADIQIRRQNISNLLEVNRLKNELAETTRVLQRGDGTEGSQGWLDLRADASVDGDKEFRDKYSQASRDIVGSASNSFVASAMGIHADSETTATFAAMDEHLARETQKASDNADEAQIAELSQAMADDNDVGRNEVRRADIIGAATDMLDRAGVTDRAVRTEFVQNRITVAHEGVINRLLQQDPSAAQAYYDKFEHQIRPLSRAGIEKKLGAGRMLQRAQEIANDVFDPEKSRADMQSEAREAAGDDADVAKAAVQDLVVRQAAHDADKRDAKQSVQKALSDAIKSGGGIPPALASEADADDLVNARRLERQLASREPVETDPIYFEDMMALTGREAANISLLEAETKLSRQQLLVVQNHKVAAIEGLGKDANNPNTPVAMFNAEVDALGLSGTGKEKRKKRGRFRIMFQEELANQTAVKGSELNGAEIRKILEGLTDEVVTDRNFFQRTFGLGDPEPAFANEVPVEDRRNILRAFREAGLPPPSRFDIALMHMNKEPLPVPAAAAPAPRVSMTAEDRAELTEEYQRARAAGEGGLGPNSPAEPSEEQLQAGFDRITGNR